MTSPCRRCHALENTVGLSFLACPPRCLPAGIRSPIPPASCDGGTGSGGPVRPVRPTSPVIPVMLPRPPSTRQPKPTRQPQANKKRQPPTRRGAFLLFRHGRPAPRPTRRGGASLDGEAGRAAAGPGDTHGPAVSSTHPNEIHNNRNNGAPPAASAIMSGGTCRNVVLCVAISANGPPSCGGGPRQTRRDQSRWPVAWLELTSRRDSSWRRT